MKLVLSVDRSPLDGAALTVALLSVVCAGCNEQPQRDRSTASDASPNVPVSQDSQDGSASRSPDAGSGISLDGSAAEPLPRPPAPAGCTAACQQQSLTLCLPEPGGDCVACLDDGHCATNPEAWADRCDVSRNACRCESDDQCTSTARGKRCHPSNKFCHCESDADCDGPRKCLESEQLAQGVRFCQLPCRTDADCSSATAPLCNASSGQCVACTSNGGCAASRRGGLCVDSGCGCRRDEHCLGKSAGGRRCLWQDEICGCQTDADCAGNKNGTLCVGHRCGCVDNTACKNSPGSVCGAVFGHSAALSCQAQCASDLECIKNGMRSCDQGRCVQCTSDADCKGTRDLCDTAKGRCVICRADADCTNPARPACSQRRGECVSCNSDTDCADASKPYCHAGLSICVRCTSDSHCASGSFCDAKLSRCGKCRSDADCAANPAKPRCNPKRAACEECLSDDDCVDSPNGPDCSIVWRGCSCDDDADCATSPQGRRCKLNISGTGFSQRCGCDPGKNDCPAGKACQGGRCN